MSSETKRAPGQPSRTRQALHLHFALELREDYVKASLNLDRIVRAKDEVVAERDADEMPDAYAMPGTLFEEALSDEPELVPGG